jgi:hypothetical protein
MPDVTPQRCPACDQPVLVIAGEEGTSHFADPPLLSVIFHALKHRGWKLDGDGVYVDPEGNRHGSLGAAIMAQSMREIADA